MVEIIVHGNTYKAYKCPICGCVFATSDSNIIVDSQEGRWTTCPECGEYVKTNKRTQYNP